MSIFWGPAVHDLVGKHPQSGGLVGRKQLIGGQVHTVACGTWDVQLFSRKLVEMLPVREVHYSGTSRWIVGSRQWRFPIITFPFCVLFALVR